MLSHFLKQVLTSYDEKNYRIATSHYDEVLRANATMEETSRLDLRLPSVAIRKMHSILDAAAIEIPYKGLVVDLCCGTGYVARSLLLTNKVEQIIGIDLSNGQLHLLKKAVESDNSFRSRLCLAQADTLRLPLADQTVDLVIGNSFLHHLPDVGAALVEIRRVIKPGGEFIVLHEPSVTATFFESFPLSLIKTIHIANYTDLWEFTSGDLCRLLEKAGFARIKILKTGILGHVLLGTPSILVNKFWPRWNAAKAVLEYVRSALNAWEYRVSWSRAPSLLIKAVASSQ